MNIKIGNRLKSILCLINTGVLVDIGCDHGFLGAKALYLGKAKKVAFVDISQQSLNKSKTIIEKYSLENACFFNCDGLSSVNIEYDLVVIAGIGGDEIVKILDQAKYRKDAILCAHSKVEVLRDYISGKFKINEDYYIKENHKYYPIISISNGSDVYAEDEIYFGKNTRNNTFYNEMIKNTYLILKNINDKSLKISFDLKKKLLIYKKEYERLMQEE